MAVKDTGGGGFTPAPREPDHSGNLDDAWRTIQDIFPDWNLPDFPTLGLPEGWDVERWLDEHWDGRGPDSEHRGLTLADDRPRSYGDDHRSRAPGMNAPAPLPGPWVDRTEHSGDGHRTPSGPGKPYTYPAPNTDPYVAADTAADLVAKKLRKIAVAKRDKKLGLPEDRYRVDPGGKVRKVPGTQMAYDTRDETQARAWLEKQKTKPGGLAKARQQVFYAGGYDDPENAQFGDDASYTDDDIAAVKKMMEDANNRGTRLGETLPRMASTGMAQGYPVGMDPEDAAGTSSSGGGGSKADDPLTLINEYADGNGLKLTDEWVARQVRQIGAGKRTVDESLKALQHQVIAQYPAWAEQIKDGMYVSDIAKPYQTAISTILEVPEASIGLHDPLVKRGLQAVGKDGTPSVKPLWQFENELKKDPRWQYTNNAWSEIGGMAEEAMRMFGMMP